MIEIYVIYMICLLCDATTYIKTTKMLTLINISENNIDVIGIAKSDFQVCIEIFFVRSSKMVGREHYFFDELPAYAPITRLSDNMAESMRMMADIQKFKSTLPGIDCGACGAPTCRAFAEDVIKKNACPEDCRLRDAWSKEDGKA